MDLLFHVPYPLNPAQALAAEVGAGFGAHPAGTNFATLIDPHNGHLSEKVVDIYVTNGPDFGPDVTQAEFDAFIVSMRHKYPTLF